MLHELPLCPPRPVESGRRRNCQISLSFGRPIDRRAWKSAWETLVQRHPILRTVLSNGGQSLLENERLDGSWQEPDWSAVEHGQLPEMWKELQEREAVTPFAPGSFPFWRLHLLQLPGGNSHLLWTMDPLLLDEPSAARILTEWFELYDGARKSEDSWISTASPSVALCAAEISENDPAIAKAFEELSRWTAYPLVGSEAGTGEADAPRRSESLEIPPGACEALDEFCRGHEVSPEAVLTVLWAGLLAAWNPSGESLVGARMDLRAFLPVESRDVCGRFFCRVPFRLRETPGMKGKDWLVRVARAVDGLAQGAFTAWGDEAGLAAMRLQVPALPVSTVLWEPFSLNDILHTAFPRWLGADARWQEAAVSPVILRASGDKRKVLTIEWEESLLTTGLAVEFLRQVVAGIEAVPGLAQWPGVAAVAPAPDFRLEAMPDPAPRLTEALRIGQGAAAFDGGRMGAPELLENSNRWLRFFRKHRPAPELRLLVSMSPGSDLLFVLLALLRDRVDFLWVDPVWLPELGASDFERLRVGLVLAESALAESSPESPQPKAMLVSEVRERVAAQPEGIPGERKISTAPVWGFLQTDGSERVLTEHQLSEAWNGLGAWWEVDSSSRFLWPLESLQPRHLVEMAVVLEKSGTLVLPGRELFASRSDFEECLREESITHLSLAAGRWADWMQYNREVGASLPPDLRGLLLEAGSWSPQCAAHWASSASGVAVDVWVSPFRLPGLGLHVSLPPGEFPRGEMLPLGEADTGVRVHLRNTDGQPVPAGLPGLLDIQLPPQPEEEPRLFGDASDLAGEVPQSALVAVRNARGFYFGLESPDEASNLPWPAWQTHAAKLLEIPEVLDVLLRENDARTGSMSAWLILRERPSGLTPSLARRIAAALPTHPITLAALVQRFPLDASGRINSGALPAPQPVAELLLAESNTRTSKPAKATEQPASVMPAMNIVWQGAGRSASWNLVGYGTGATPAWLSAMEGFSPSGGVGALIRPAGILSAGLIEGMVGSLREVPSLYLAAAGRDVWDVVRLAHWLQKSGFPPTGLFLLDPEPPETEPLATLTSRMKSALRFFGNKGGNARREAPAPPRLVPIHLPCFVLLAEGREASFENWLLDAKYYAADLSTPGSTAEAVLSLFDTPSDGAEEESTDIESPQEPSEDSEREPE